MLINKDEYEKKVVSYDKIVKNILSERDKEH